MNFRQLEAFAAVVEYRSFSKAARKLFLTQPTVSAHISALEAELGKDLIVRTTKRIYLTADGEKLYGYAARILDLKKMALSDLGGKEGITIRIGASSLPAAYLLPKAVAKFRESHPEVDFDIWRSDSIEVIEKLQDGVFDLGLTGTLMPEKQCIFEPFYIDELVIATPASEYFSKLKAAAVTTEVLLQEPLIIREKGSGTRHETERLLSRMGISLESLNIALCMNNPENIPNSIMAGIGISIISRKIVEDLEKEGKLLMFPLEDSSAYRDMYIVRLKDKQLNRQTKEFVHLLKETYTEEIN